MNGSRTKLSRLLDDCTVLIRLPGFPEAGGTGFFVAPGFVLTCAHVLGKPDRVAIGDQVRVRWHESDYTATVVRALPAEKGREDLWAGPDLAVVRLDDPPDGHPCAWLDETEVEQEAHVYVAGFQVVFTLRPRLGNAILVYTGPLSLDADHSMMRLKGDELPSGMSGGPVLDTVRGTVCGVAKANRRPDAPYGGLAVPAAQIHAALPDIWQQNAAWRARDGTWRALQEAARHENAGTDLLAMDEMAAVERAWNLAGISAAALFTHMFNGLRPWPDDGLTGIVDLICEAADTAAPLPGERHPLLVLLDALGGAAPNGSELRAISTRVAQRLGVKDEPSPHALIGRTAAIEIVIWPSGSDRTKYLLIARIFRDLALPPEVSRADDEPVKLPAIKTQVGRLLPAYLQSLGRDDRDVNIEFTLPIHLICQPVEEWHTGESWAPLGLEFPVLLRVSNRAPESFPAWRRKWKNLHEQQAHPHWVDCRVGRTRRQLLAEFQPDSESVLAVTYRPDNRRGRDVLEAALRAGVPAAIWPASKCPEHKQRQDVTDCAGDKFRASMSERVSQDRLTDLPHLVKKLRGEAENSGGFPGHGLALLWDDPGRPYQMDETPLAEPEQSAVGMPNGRRR